MRDDNSTSDYVVTDALTGDEVSFSYGTGVATFRHGEGLPACSSLFFPGCSLINYAMPLAAAVFDTLRAAGAADGMSVLCCGKILAYEPDGARVRATFEDQLRERLASTSITRIVAACPNCVRALSEALAADERTARIEIVPLPRVLADAGYRIDRATAAEVLRGDAAAAVTLAVHDSCPDRDSGAFARGLRDMFAEGVCVDPAHNRARSLCCGSLPRAAGKFDAADKLAIRNGEEALDVGADAIVAACMSCVFQLNTAPSPVPAVHFLELLYRWRVDWSRVGAWMKLRFLFDETMGAVEEGGRAFAGLS